MLNLDTYTLSSALPESFTVDTDQGEEYVEVHISLDGSCIYSTRLYGDANGTCTFYELRQIVEQSMIARNLTLASFSLTVAHENGADELEDKYIIFSRYKNAERYTAGFLESHFLVSRASYMIPRNVYGSLPFFATAEEDVSPYLDCVFDKDGEIYNFRLENPIHHYNRPSMYYISVYPPSIKARADNEEGEDCGKLLSISVHAGRRTVTVYVVDEEPCIQFYFRNCYNAVEVMPVFGTTTLKTEISRKEAVSGDVISFYDKSVSRKWQVKTVPLSQEEARWYNEFLESDYVYLELNQDFNDLRILISDITSEISDSSKDLVHIKFSWRFEDNSVWINEDHFPQVFSAPYNDTFK